MKKKDLRSFWVVLVPVIIVFCIVFVVIARNFVLAKTEIKISKKNITLHEGKTKKLNLTGVSAANKEKIVWKSSDSTIAVVSESGKVKAKNKGKANITAIYMDKKYVCKVLVIAKEKEEMNNIPEHPGQEYEKATAHTKVKDIINNKAFSGYGRLLFPVDYPISGNLPLDQIGTLMPYHNYINTDKTVEIVNTMLEKRAAGETIFYDIYTDEEKKKEPEKENTGLFLFRGKPGAKFAVINAGGGFAYVGAMHESFPHALELSKKGYNAFALVYRTGGAQKACEDLARAISFIFSHADELQVDTECYSLWGGSAGARMAAYLGSYGPGQYGGDSLPCPGTVIMQYTGHSDYTKNDPPTYACIGSDDGIASPYTMKTRLDKMSAAGIDTEFHEYPGVRHGFGLGIGTPAEGWIDTAVAFWEKHM